MGSSRKKTSKTLQAGTPMIPSFPKIIPELNYPSEEFLRPFFYNTKRKLVATFFYKPFIQEEKIYLKNIRTGITKYMPLFNLSYALSFYNDYIKTGNEYYKEKFIQKAEELLEQVTWDGELCGWKYAKNYSLPGYPPIIESYSALFQGRGLSMLLRYRQFKPTAKVDKIIKGILRSFQLDTDKGGVRKVNGEKIWYLEYSYGKESPVVYNGFLSSLISLEEVSLHGNVAEQKLAKQLLEEGLRTLINSSEELFIQKPFTWLRYDSHKLYFADGDYYNIMKKEIEELAKTKKELRVLETKIKKVWEKNKFFGEVFEWIYYVHKKVMK